MNIKSITLWVLCLVLSVTVVFGANIKIYQNGSSTVDTTKTFPADINDDKRFTTEVFQDGATLTGTASSTSTSGSKVDTLLVPIRSTTTSIASSAIIAGYLYMEWVAGSDNNVRFTYKDATGTTRIATLTFSTAP